MELPSLDTFESYDTIYKNIAYLVEDNDLWVDTSIKEIDGKTYLVRILLLPQKIGNHQKYFL